jgi:hypothetical protein
MARALQDFIFICVVVLLVWPSSVFAAQAGWSTTTTDVTSPNGAVYEFTFDCPQQFATGEFYTIPISFTVKSFGTDVVEARVISIKLDISTPSALFVTDPRSEDAELKLVGSGFSTTWLIRIFDKDVGLSEGQARLGWFTPIVRVEEHLKDGQISDNDIWATVRPTFVSPESELQTGSLLMNLFTQFSTILAVVAIILSAVALGVSLGKRRSQSLTQNKV